MSEAVTISVHGKYWIAGQLGMDLSAPCSECGSAVIWNVQYEHLYVEHGTKGYGPDGSEDQGGTFPPVLQHMVYWLTGRCENCQCIFATKNCRATHARDSGIPEPKEPEIDSDPS